jgi:hypothetical protein
MGSPCVVVIIDMQFWQHALVQNADDQDVAAVTPVEDDVLPLLTTA